MMNAGILGVADVLLLLLWARAIVWTFLSCRWYATRPKLTTTPPAALEPSRISIIVPAYNEEQNIVAVLQSLTALAPAADEIVVVDDGSTDRTALLVGEYLKQFPRIQLIRLARNQGKAAALNAGFAITTGDLVATVDADTTLAVDALGMALAEMIEQNADAVAFRIDVAKHQSLLSQLQGQEYALGFNFERAGQSLVGAIGVLPGAATLFRRKALPSPPFSARTRTEDADLTLGLSSRGRRLAMAGRAQASTLAPTSLIRLLRQRVRWTTGHLHCCLVNFPRFGQNPWFALLVFPNFLIATLASSLLCLLMVFILFTGRTGWLGLSFVETASVSMVVTYGQRVLACIMIGYRPAGLGRFILEPLVTGAVCSLSMFGALAIAVRSALRGMRHRLAVW